MKNRFHKALSLLAVLLLVACSSEEANIPNRQIFDIPTYFESVIADFQQQSVGVKELVVINGEEEELQSMEVDWNKKLKPFLEVSLNKPAYQSIIKIDSVQEGQDIKVVHSINSDQHAIKSFSIWYDKHDLTTPMRMEFEFENDNFLYCSTKHLSFDPMDGFALKSTNKVVVLGEHKVQINAKFVR